MLEDLVPQRWGVGSTMLHLDVAALALGVLLFDRIVLPTPSDIKEADRWDQLGWNTQAQALRINQLGELVHFAPWDAHLRADWQAQWEHIRAVGGATRNLAFALTPQIIAASAWNDVMRSAGPDSVPRVRPMPVTWAPGIGSVVAGGGLEGDVLHDPRPDNESLVRESPTALAQEPPTPTAPYEQISALHFQRVLKQPARDDPEATLDAALTLANSADFQAARRALYTAEALAAAGQLPAPEFAADIEAAVVRYNQVVTAYSGATVRRVIHHVVPEFIADLPPLASVPGIGSAVQWLVKRVLARLLPLPPPPQPGLDEGAALGMTQHAMSAVCAMTSRPGGQ